MHHPETIHSLQERLRGARDRMVSRRIFPKTQDMNKAKILYYYGFQHFNTGSPKALAALIEAMDRSRFEPIFLAKGDGPLIEALIAKGVKIVRKDVGAISYRHPVSSLRQIRRMVACLDEIRPDLVHVMGFEWNLDLVFAAWTRRIPIVLHVHTPEGADFRNLHRIAATKVLFCSESERQNFQHLERIISKTDVLYNAVDVRRFAEAQPTRREFGLKPHQIAIGTIAQIRKGKGIDIILEVARLLRDDRLVFLIVGPDGTGEERFAAEMRAQAVEDPALRSRVRFLGPRQDIPEFLKSLDLFVLPTRAEAFGIAIVEAMASGIPVVATETGGVSEIVHSAETGRLVSEFTPGAFAKTITEVLTLPDCGRAMAAKAQESVRQRFDSAVIGQKLGSIYTEVLGVR
jgi:glycosyltransferase involved in cell wall biosynthesis